MANPHRLHPTADEMSRLARFARGLMAAVTAAVAKTAAFDNSASTTGMSGVYLFDSTTAFDITIPAPKPGNVLVVAVKQAAGSGTHRIVPATNVVVKESDGTTSLTTAITFGTTAVVGTYVVLEYVSDTTWKVTRKGVDASVVNAAVTGLTES